MSHPQRSTGRRPSGTGSPDPVLITDAARSYEDELRTRKRRYAVMMGMRIPCMVLAVFFYQIPWLAVGLLVLSIPLPWMAVLIANDRLPRKREEVNRYRGDRTSLAVSPQPMIEAPRYGTVVDGEVFGTRMHDDRFTDGSSRWDGRRAG